MMEVNQSNFLFVLSKIRQKQFTWLEAEMSRSGISDISPSYGDVLFVLDVKGPLTLLEIAEGTKKDKSTVSSVVKRLEEAGYVTKEKGEGDGRFVKIKLTPKAKKVRAKLMNISQAMNEKLFDGFTEKEKKTLYSLMDKLYGNVT